MANRSLGGQGVAMGLSSFSTTPLEEVVAAAKEHGDIDHVLQLYVMKNRRTSETLVRRAESKFFQPHLTRQNKSWYFLVTWTVEPPRCTLLPCSTVEHD